MVAPEDVSYCRKAHSGKRWGCGSGGAPPLHRRIDRHCAGKMHGGRNRTTGQSAGKPKRRVQSPMVAGDPHRQVRKVPRQSYTQLHLTCPEFDAHRLCRAWRSCLPHFCHTRDVACVSPIAFARLFTMSLYRAVSERMAAEIPDGMGIKRSENTASKPSS